MSIIRIEYTDYRALNTVDREAAMKYVEDAKGPLLAAEIPGSILFADVTEHRFLPLFGLRLFHSSRRVRVFRSLFKPWWCYLDTGLPTPGYGVERCALTDAARGEAIRTLTSME